VTVDTRPGAEAADTAGAPPAGRMAEPAAGPPRVGWRRRVREALPWVLLALGLVVLGLLTGGQDTGVPLDPGSTGSFGTKALVEVLDELGAVVTVGDQVPASGTATALLLSDQLPPERRADLRDWVGSGGILLVADPTSEVTRVSIADLAGTGGVLAEPLERGCAVPAFAKIPTFDNADGVLYAVEAGTVGCYLRDGNAWALVQPIGQGTVVRLGGPTILTNGQIAQDQNAGLAAAVLAPTPGTRVQVIWPGLGGAQPGDGGPGGSGLRGSLSDLLPSGVRAALWQLAAAFGVLALWRGRRLGRPVAEPQPVELPASELVVSVGNLLQRAGRRDQAAATLAADLRRFLAERLGLPASSDAGVVADAVAARTGIDRDRVLDALDTRPTTDERDLVRRAQAIDAIRREVTRVR
jgi:hypothetical protein